MAMTYGEYLKVEPLLNLQQPLSDGPEHDEHLFIVIHQVYELWFKQILHEMDFLTVAMHKGETPQVLATFKRILTILKTLVAQVDVLETMTPISFTSFRTRLQNASGFQSAQFREVEFLLGAKRPQVIEQMADGDPARERLKTRLHAPSLYDSFLRYLKVLGYAIPDEALAHDVSTIRGESEAVQAVLIELYRSSAPATAVCERLVDLDEGLQEWRYRHVKMVERTIGFKRGTGGSAGAEYLRSTLFKPAFPDLWTIRAQL